MTFHIDCRPPAKRRKLRTDTDLPPYAWHLPHRSSSQRSRVCQGQGGLASGAPSSLISNRFPPPGPTGMTPGPKALQSGTSYCHVTEGLVGVQLETDSWTKYTGEHKRGSHFWTFLSWRNLFNPALSFHSYASQLVYLNTWPCDSLGGLWYCTLQSGGHNHYNFPQ